MLISMISLALGVVASVDATQVFDYIVVGGGTTGLVVANRLSENYNSMFVILR